MNDGEAARLERARYGDKVAFSELVEQHHDQVYGLCYRMLGNTHDAEDAAQETFLRAYRAIKSYDPSKKFITWLLSIAANFCIDQHRRRTPLVLEYDQAHPTQLSDPGPGVEAQLLRREKQQQVQSLLDRLKPKDRAALVLRFWYEYSYEEIAASLSLSESAVKSRLHRSRLELARSWHEGESKQLLIERTTHESPAV